MNIQEFYNLNCNRKLVLYFKDRKKRRVIGVLLNFNNTDVIIKTRKSEIRIPFSELNAYKIFRGANYRKKLHPNRIKKPRIKKEEKKSFMEKFILWLKRK